MVLSTMMIWIGLEVGTTSTCSFSGDSEIQVSALRGVSFQRCISRCFGAPVVGDVAFLITFSASLHWEVLMVMYYELRETRRACDGTWTSRFKNLGRNEEKEKQD